MYLLCWATQHTDVRRVRCASLQLRISKCVFFKEVENGGKKCLLWKVNAVPFFNILCRFVLLYPFLSQESFRKKDRRYRNVFSPCSLFICFFFIHVFKQPIRSPMICTVKNENMLSSMSAHPTNGNKKFQSYRAAMTRAVACVLSDGSLLWSIFCKAKVSFCFLFLREDVSDGLEKERKGEKRTYFLPGGEVSLCSKPLFFRGEGFFHTFS